MARSHGAKRHFNDFPGSSLGRESDGYLCVTLQFQAPVYGWFTEGFDTRDLKEAKALLNKLQ